MRILELKLEALLGALLLATVCPQVKAFSLSAPQPLSHGGYRSLQASARDKPPAPGAKRSRVRQSSLAHNVAVSAPQHPVQVKTNGKLKPRTQGGDFQIPQHSAALEVDLSDLSALEENNRATPMHDLLKAFGLRCSNQHGSKAAMAQTLSTNAFCSAPQHPDEVEELTPLQVFRECQLHSLNTAGSHQERSRRLRAQLLNDSAAQPLSTKPPKSHKDLSFTTKVVHGSGEVEDGLGSVNMPIYQTSTFRFSSAEEGARCFAGESDGYIYTRINNPTVRELEKTLAMLENGHDAIATSSGMGAVNVVFMALLSGKSHVICHQTVYGPSRSLLENHFKKFGVETSFIDTCDMKAVESAIRKDTALIYLESPANPTVSISDIPAISELAQQHNIPVCVDNTFCGPYLQTPLDLGADIVLHSLTKSLNGHADIVGGVIVTKSAEMDKKLRPMMVTLGPCMDPNQAFLVRRGLKTLPLRIDRAQETAIKVANYLENHPKVAWVAYPGLKSHPQHKLSKEIMKGPGCMMSFGIKGGVAEGRQFLNSLRLCVLAVSLGGVETLIQHPASMTHAKLSPEARQQGGVSDDLVRLSIGIEDAEEIIDDLGQALDQINV